MLDIKTATIVQKAINEHFSNSNPVSLEAVCRMQPIPQNTSGSGYTILGLQLGDLTILVWVYFSEESGVMVKSVKAMPW